MITMDLWHDIESGKPEELNVIIEIPKGSQNKYEFDKETGLFKLDRVLFSPLHYPGDYGFIPKTLCEDGDPLDALILINFPTYPGMLIKARPIGLMKMNDGGEEDDKLLCVPVDDVRFEGIQDIKDVHKSVLNEIAHFFQVYKELEKKKVEVKGWFDKAEAMKVIEESLKLYKEKFQK